MTRSKISIPFLTQSMAFPLVELANDDGLLAVGGDLSAERLITAYKQGIFPWFNDDSLILWWAPDPRMVLFPPKLKISRSMQKIIASGRFSFTRNQEFEEVLTKCATVSRKGQPGTWITPEMQKSYLQLHRLGLAVSYEAWEGGRLAGGLYGIDLGHIFCGESMFHTADNASKFAFIMMVEELKHKGYRLLDCQVHNPHLQSLGAEEIARDQYMEILSRKAL